MGAAEDTLELTPEEVAEYRRLRPLLRLLSKLVASGAADEPAAARKDPRDAEPNAEDYEIARKRLERGGRRG